MIDPAIPIIHLCFAALSVELARVSFHTKNNEMMFIHFEIENRERMKSSDEN